jgi:glutathionylspermidine synthase
VRRLTISPRAGWQGIVESQGLVFHTAGGAPYWDESVCYAFTPREAGVLEQATAELQRLCLEAGQHIIDKNRFAEMAIPEEAAKLARDAWEKEPPALYGRFDLAYAGGESPPKLLEYNADTPTSLLEASVIQWHWMKDVFPHADQFNSIHERLLEKWKELGAYLRPGPVHFACVKDSAEDFMTVSYLRDLAEQAGFETAFLNVEDIGWNPLRMRFSDLDGGGIASIFKLYPWEWMVREDFAQYLPYVADKMDWMEPAWKMMWSNKALLPLLWELFPDHPNLLPCSRRAPRDPLNYVKKPILSREGANVTIIREGHAPVVVSGTYGAEGFIYQDVAELPDFGGKTPVIGSWVIDGEPGGMGVREADGPVTNNLSRFVPHFIAE